MKTKLLVLAILLNFYGHRCTEQPSSLVDERKECSALLSTDLIKEIQSYQPIVEQIITEAAYGSFSGNTWNRFVHRSFCLDAVILTISMLRNCNLVWPNSRINLVVVWPERRISKIPSTMC